MRGTKKQSSTGSVDAKGPPVRRRRPSISQNNAGRRREDGDDDGHNHESRHIQNNRYYAQSSSNAPIFNGPIYGGVHNSPQISTLDGLQYLCQHAAMGAMHGSNERYPPPLCYPGTRDVVVRRIIGWYLDKDGQKKIMWVHAPLGYGKTAVAGTVKDKLDAMELDFDSPVGATFFFWRGSPERSSPARFIITLAYQLAQSIPALGPRVEAAVKSKPAIVKMALELQLIKLIVEPFKALDNLDAMPNRLVIIDGIDECINSDRESPVEKKYAEDQESVQIRVLDLIHSLHSHHLPLSFLILSRPEAWIKRHLESARFRDVVEPLDLYEVGDHMNDVRLFVRAELSRIAKSFDLEGADEEWPETELVVMSEGHMTYASTVIRHIDDPYGDPRQLLKDIINKPSTANPAISHSTPFSSLYELYRQIMRSCPERNRTVMIEVLEDVMTPPYCGPTVVGHEMTLRLLDRVSGRPSDCGVKALRPLHAVLRVGRGNEDVETFHLFIHSSFREFLRNPSLSFEFAVDVRKGRERLLSKMLDYMASITTDTVGSKVEDVVVIALNNWCRYWDSGRWTFLNSEATYLYMMEKVMALDLTACIIQTYHAIYAGSEDSPLGYLFSSRLTRNENSLFHVKSKKLDALAEKLRSHAQSSVEEAFISLLQSSDLPEDGRSIMPRDCSYYLRDVISKPSWSENKLVQALGSPGPNEVDVFRKVIDELYKRYYDLDDSDGDEQQTCNLLEHIYTTMRHKKNPILESEDDPFDSFPWLDKTDSESDSGSDRWRGTYIIDSDG